MLYRDNVHAGRAEYKAPGSKFLTQVQQMFTVVIGYPRNYQIRVIKLIRGSNILKYYSSTVLNMQYINYKLICVIVFAKSLLNRREKHFS